VEAYPQGEIKMAEVNSPAQYDPSAFYANRVAVTFNSLGVRIAFGESPDGSIKGEKFAHAHFLPHEVFSSMVDMFDDIRNQIEHLRNAPTGPVAKSN